MTVLVTIIAINNFTRRVSYDFMSRTANTILILKKNNITVYRKCIEFIFETHYYSHDIYTYTLFLLNYFKYFIVEWAESNYIFHFLIQ